MPQFPGFPSNDFDFHFEEAGGALAGLLMRSRSGDVIPGVLPNVETLLSAGGGWTIRVAPFVAARSKGRAVLLGGTTEEVILDVDPAPAANARLDVIYTLPADVGAGDPPRGVAVAKGIPGAVPAKPVIPVGGIELGTFRVSAGQSGAASAVLVDTFAFAALTGGELRVRKRTDLAQRDVIDGTRAFVLEDGSSPERVNGSWVTSKTSPYIAPFKAYSSSVPSVLVDVDQGQVVVSGACTTSKPAELVGGTNRLVADIGRGYAPRRSEYVVAQGSGTDRYLITLDTDGKMTAARYGTGAPTASVWMPFKLSYPLKRV